MRDLEEREIKKVMEGGKKKVMGREGREERRRIRGEERKGRGRRKRQMESEGER